MSARPSRCGAGRAVARAGAPDRSSSAGDDSPAGHAQRPQGQQDASPAPPPRAPRAPTTGGCQPDVAAPRGGLPGRRAPVVAVPAAPGGHAAGSAAVGPPSGSARPRRGRRSQGRVERVLVDAGRVERVAAAPVRQRQQGRDPDVLLGDRVAPAPGRVRHRGAGDDDVGAHAVDLEGGAHGGDPAQLGVGQPTRGSAGLRGRDAVRRRAPRRRAQRGGEAGRVVVEGEPAADDLDPGADVARRRDLDGQPEPVEQLRPQLALLRVHRADQQEPGRVRHRHPVALDVRPAHRGGVEQQVDEVVVQQVDLVDVQHPAVGVGEQARARRPSRPRPAPAPGRASRPAGPRSRRPAARPAGRVPGVAAAGRVRAVRAVGVGRRGVAGEPAARRRPSHRRAAAPPARARPSTSPCPSRRAPARRRRPGDTALSSSASRRSSWPTTAVNGNVLVLITGEPARADVIDRQLRPGHRAR